MATIIPRKRKGGMRYTALIRIKRNGKVIFSESETFTKKSLAKEWGARRDAELKHPNALEHLRYQDLTIGQVLEWYRDDFDGKSKFGRSKLSHINFLINYLEFSALSAIDLNSGQLVAHVHERRRGGAGAATVNNDLIWLRNAFRAVRIGRNVPLNLQVIDDAAYLCRKEKLVAKSKQRERRPTVDELNLLLDYFDGRDRRSSIPMVDVMLFALFSSRRQDEIRRIKWSDLDEENQRVLVRDMKHPREKTDTWVFLTDLAWQLLQQQKNTADEIFPYNGKSVSSAFTRACQVLEIEDLRFHDLRHECTSWLFELGWDIPRVSSVTGHKSWSSLQRYTHIREFGIKDKYKDWKWNP